MSKAGENEVVHCKCNKPVEVRITKDTNPNPDRRGCKYYSCDVCKFYRFIPKEKKAENNKKKKSTKGKDTDSPSQPRCISIADLKDAYFIFTDGSCLGNQSVATTQNLAGWGFVAVRLKESAIRQIESRLVRPEDLVDISSNSFFANYFTAESCENVIEMYGPILVKNEHYSTFDLPVFDRVDREELELCYLGATVTSNNTGELSAIGEAIIWLKENFHLYPKYFFILYDSEYAAKSVQGIFNGEKNKDIITEIRKLYKEMNEKIQEQSFSMKAPFTGTTYPRGISFLHIKAHANHYWNELADQLANKGSTDLCKTGRYAKFSSKPADKLASQGIEGKFSETGRYQRLQNLLPEEITSQSLGSGRYKKVMNHPSDMQAKDHSLFERKTPQATKSNQSYLSLDEDEEQVIKLQDDREADLETADEDEPPTKKLKTIPFAPSTPTSTLPKGAVIDLSLSPPIVAPTSVPSLIRPRRRFTGEIKVNSPKVFEIDS